jgi:hypothetical protein
MRVARRIFLKLKRTYHQPRFVRALLGILDTPFVPVGTMPFTLVSMVQSRDVLPYLVAVKSFARYANPRRIVVVCDPSITAADRIVFNQHIPHVELRDAGEFTHENIPLGGTWERLYAISEYCKQDYVVQLDADTITMLPPAEVIHAVMANTAFVMSGEASSVLMTLEETAALASSWEHSGPGQQHIQDVVERSIASSNLPTSAQYVRGCSGFTGFPRSPTMSEELLAFSRAMQVQHGIRWAEWGTEQITSNYLVANAPGTTVLPFLSYGTPDVFHRDSILTHFIGSMRFTSNKYRAATLQAIRQLASAPATATAPAMELELALTLALAPKETDVFLGSVKIR